MTGQRLVVLAFVIIAILVTVVWMVLLLQDRLNTEVNVLMSAVVGGLSTIAIRGDSGQTK